MTARVARVGLVGAGYIASWHLDALRRTPGVTVTAVVDPNLRAAERIAAQADRAQAFASLGDAVAAGVLDRVHVLVPPHLHAAVARESLQAGLATLVEKPLGVNAGEARDLVDLAAERSVALGVNQNFMFEPALVQFAQELGAGRYGSLRHVNATCVVPLRQLAARQFGHWMFERPSNIVLEQMVHPLSQLALLLGEVTVTAAAAAPAVELAPGLLFHHDFDVSLRGAGATAQLHLGFARGYPTRQLQCICDDAVVVLDLGRGVILRTRRSRYMDQADATLSTVSTGGSGIAQAVSGAVRYLGSQIGVLESPNPFLRSMVGSVRAFHAAVDADAPPPVDGALGARLVELCDDVARLAKVSDHPAPTPRRLRRHGETVPEFDVAVLGGTGFIGRATVSALLDAGYTVGVLARSMRGLPQAFESDAVHLIVGDVSRAEDVARGVGSARRVVHLAPGASGSSRAAIVEGMIGSARVIAEACLERGVERLVHVGSIASLYLGDPREVISPATPADPDGAQRADYSFAKAEAERLLLRWHRERGLPVVVQRPGVVVGEGASPFHSGVGMFNNEQHCLGWSAGRNPLPFVLVQDCAAAILAALAADDAVLGRTDNIVGAVRLSAREYLGELAAAIGRPLVFHGHSPRALQALEAAKWSIKRLGGRAVAFPSLRDFRSRGMAATFDTRETEQVLGWQPTTSREVFVDLGVRAPGRAL